MKRFRQLSTAVLALFTIAITSPVVAQESIGDRLEKNIQTELDKVGKEVTARIVEMAQKIVADAVKKAEAATSKVQAELEKRTARVAELEKQVGAGKERIAELEKALTNLRKEVEALTKSRKPASKAYLGIAHVELTDEQRKELSLDSRQGARVTAVIPRGPAAVAGLQKDDVILALGDHRVGSANLDEVLGGFPADASVAVGFVRDGERHTKTVTLVDRDVFASQKSKVDEAPEEEKPTVVLGVLIEEKDAGLEVQNVEDGLTGSAAQLERGDLLLAVNGKKVTTLDDLREAFGKIHAGDKMSLKIARKSKEIDVTVVAGSKPGEAKLVASSVQEEEKKPEPKPEPKPQPEKVASKPGFFGVTVEQGDGTVTVVSVASGSAAAAYGLEVNDVITRIGDSAVSTIADLQEGLSGKHAGDTVDVTFRRGDATVKIEGIQLGARGETVEAPEKIARTVEKPQNREPGVLGLVAQETDSAIVIVELSDDGPASKASLQEDDIILKLDDTPVKTFDDMLRALKGKYAGDKVVVVVSRDGKEESLEVTLGKKG